MTPATCHRCQSDLPPHDDGTLIFCSHCGAPQVLLSEELQAQLETRTNSESLAADAPESTAHGPGGRQDNIWAAGLRCVGLAAGIAAALAALSGAWPPFILLTWLWAVTSPVIVLGVFQARSPETPITPGFGARLGLLTGMAIALVLTMINTVTLLAMRQMHGMGEFDTVMSAKIDQMRAQAAMQPGSPALPFAQAMALPEFRAGMLLAGMAFMGLLLVALTTAGGAFAGFLRSRARASL